MNAITLRNIPPEIQRLIEKRTRETGSVNKAVISLLEECTGRKNKKRSEQLHHDLDSLSGAWTKTEADEFDRFLALERQVDAELWK